MERFRKLVEAGPIGLQPWAEEKLGCYASEIIRFDTLPESEDELVARIGDADAVLVRTQPAVPASVLSRCSSLRYVGMCCSLYSKESANDYAGNAQYHKWEQKCGGGFASACSKCAHDGIVFSPSGYVEVDDKDSGNDGDKDKEDDAYNGEALSTLVAVYNFQPAAVVESDG